MAKKILIIEDDSAFQKALKKSLEREEYEVSAVSDGDTGIRAASEERPDLILLDIILPKKSGFEVMKYISSKPELASIPVIVLTNLEGSNDVEKMLTMGAQAFLVKANYSIKEIVDVIKRILK